MTTHDDIRRICAALPEATEGLDYFGFSVPVKGKERGFLWMWRERIDPKKARVPNPKVIAVSVPNLTAKDFLIASEPDKFFTEPHYNGYPAILVRLDAIAPTEMEELLVEAWRCRAPAALVRAFDARGRL